MKSPNARFIVLTMSSVIGLSVLTMKADVTVIVLEVEELEAGVTLGAVSFAGGRLGS